MATAATGEVLLRLQGVRREYHTGDETVVALRDVDLEIRAGEMISIVGASGSGKSTLMNILGCLDRPTAGRYEVAGRETGQLGPDDLAELRREHFGFIFQRYHLLGDLPAVRNVEVPAIYSGRAPEARRGRAEELLRRLGLGHRLWNRPSQLSGGQQQRVSIARALMNGGAVILADEPTGALDSHSGEQLLALLKELNQEGHTIIIVTHDPKVAQHAQRVIEVSDGLVVADRVTQQAPGDRPPPRTIAPAPRSGLLRALIERFEEAFSMAMVAMNAHRMRTFLTMLGIIIGIASVVTIVGIGNGAQQQILEDISSLGTNTLDIRAGRGFGDMRAGMVDTLNERDADALAQQPWVDGVTPMTSTSATAQAGNVSVSAQVSGVGADYFKVRGRTLEAGSLFDAETVKAAAQVGVLEPQGAEKLFGSSQAAIGQMVLVGSVPVRIVGVLAKSQNNMMMSSNSVNVYVPYRTVNTRFTGSTRLQNMTVKVADRSDTTAAEAATRAFLKQRHGTEDFTIENSDSFRKTITKVTGNLTLLVSAIAVISLVVGGIGVMNIMLVSVTERTREIGVRMAVGARQGDIMQQFLIEAVLVCLIGGMLGLAIALGLSIAVSKIASDFRMVISAGSIAAAFACCTLIGVGFGFLPARSAARLDPVEALARD